MMEDSTFHFRDSLDFSEAELEQFIPYLLQDLLQLGSMPHHMVTLLKRHLSLPFTGKACDLGCGKGAVLIMLAAELGISGEGVDLVESFINDANSHAARLGVSGKVSFLCADMTAYLTTQQNCDMLIYGYDSGAFGGMAATLGVFRKHLRQDGILILETSHTEEGTARIDDVPTAKELVTDLRESPFNIIDHITWPKNEIEAFNRLANKSIDRRTRELISLHPRLTRLFENYRHEQVEESRLLEEQITCMTWLLRAK